MGLFLAQVDVGRSTCIQNRHVRLGLNFDDMRIVPRDGQLINSMMIIIEYYIRNTTPLHILTYYTYLSSDLIDTNILRRCHTLYRFASIYGSSTSAMNNTISIWSIVLFHWRGSPLLKTRQHISLTKHTYWNVAYFVHAQHNSGILLRIVHSIQHPYTHAALQSDCQM